MILLRKLFRTAWQYKAQFISMVIMIAISTGVFLGFNMEWKSIESDTDAFFEQTNYADFRLYFENGFSEDDIEAVKDIAGVDEACRFLQVNADVKDSGDTCAVLVSEDYTVSTMLVTEGEEYDKNSADIWLSDRYAEENDIAVGDEFTLIYGGIEITGEIAGLCKSGEMMICTSGEEQLMPDYSVYGFAYITPAKLKDALGTEFYSQINIISDLEKEDMEEKCKEALGRTVMVSPKEDHTAYAGALSESEEGKTMGSVLPVFFLVIGVLTMVTTMHRIAANEKVQIGTLKALGFRDARILRHYTSYGLVTGLIGIAAGVLLGYWMAAFIMSESGMMSTYFDLPAWPLVMPGFCIPILAAMLLLLTFISFLSVKKMLRGTAADALRPYVPKKFRRLLIEKLKIWERFSFGTKWNLRDVLRHKSRSAMTLLGVMGCMLLLVAGFGAKDSMAAFLDSIGEDISNYETKVTLSENTSEEDALALCEELSGAWVSSSGISYEGKTVVLEIYSEGNDKLRLINEDNSIADIGDDGVYLCLRLKDTAEIGDEIEFSPYGSDDTYKVKVAGYLRSLVTENIVMTEDYAKECGIAYTITSIYTDEAADDINASQIISGKQERQTVMDTYESFMEIMNTMIVILAVAAIALGVVVLYNLGVMSYMERRRDLATLKVLGFRDGRIGRLLISQNMWLTVIGAAIGIPAGVGTLKLLMTALASEYELSVRIGAFSYIISLAVTFGMSLAVSFFVAKKNKKIDMVEALKGAE